VSLLSTAKKLAKGTAKAAKAANQVAQGERCYACGALGPVGWVDRQPYGRGCGHYRKMAQSGGTTVERAVKRDGHAKAAQPPRRGKPGGPAQRGRHRDGHWAPYTGTSTSGRHRGK
jgi:hypothetical protein